MFRHVRDFSGVFQFPWQDTRLDWLFAHMSDAAEAHVAALLVGAGAGEQATPKTHGGNLTGAIAASSTTISTAFALRILLPA
ncbi:MAG: hypothetical protein JW940_32055 [Polyangiaceae bacterium]|nr:hypothetical protein [Polyangiaceae bacterium]